MKKIKASVFPTVLVISVLVLILIAFQLWDISVYYYSRYHFEKQQRLNLSSAITLYCNDSLFENRLDTEGKFQLYKKDPHSIVYLKHDYWGGYEYVSVCTFDKKIEAIHLLGKAEDTYRALALWLCDRDIPLSLSGYAELKGNIFIPKNGINYTNFNSDSYHGQIVPFNCIHTSEMELPPLDSAFVKRMEIYMKTPVSLSTSSLPPSYHSFLENSISVHITDYPESLYAKGQLILYADKILIPASCMLSDIILVARHVTIGSGFNGSLQVMATDTVVVEEGAYLHYPSGIYLRGNEGNTFLHISKNACLEGYAIINGNAEGGDGFSIDIHYRQERDSQVVGLLYVDGTTHLEGVVSGCAYLKHCYYLLGNSQCSGLIYNGIIERNSNVAFPFLFKESGYKRKVIKKIQ